LQPVFLSASDVLLQGTKSLSHKVFTNLSYTWDRDNWIPYLGIGGSAEFGQTMECLVTITAPIIVQQAAAAHAVTVHCRNGLFGLKVVYHLIDKYLTSF
jgi:hypothetical protein